MSLELPDKLYKYHTFKVKEHYEGLLGESKIHCASPDKFSDPYDCKIIPAFNLGSDQEIFEKFLLLISDQYPTYSIQEQIETTLIIYTENIKIFRSPELLAKSTEEKMNTLFGVCSFTEKYNNLLMWSHYADSHKGFCVEFNSEEMWKNLSNYIKIEKLVNLDKVTYKKKYPILDPFLSPDNDTDNYLNELLCKSKCWKYEREWRVIYSDHPNEVIQLPDGVITGVYFGSKSDDKQIEDAKKLFISKSSIPKFYKMKLKSRKFGLEHFEI